MDEHKLLMRIAMGAIVAIAVASVMSAVREPRRYHGDDDARVCRACGR